MAVIAQLSSLNQPAKKQAGIMTTLIVIVPFILAVGLFYLGRYFGTYQGNTLSRVCGTIVSTIGLIIYLLSHVYLRRNWSLSASIKEAHQLVTGGIYRFVRHPMYSSMIMIVLGSGLLVDNYLIMLSTSLVGITCHIRATREESLLAEEFPEYREYSKKTKMFIPWIY
jgi:protein-S-isoprenylcysteine O-methyltransferase Ste14